MSEKAKEILKARMDAVSDLIERYPLYIPVIAAGGQSVVQQIPHNRKHQTAAV